MGLKACHDRNITHRDIKPGTDGTVPILSLFSVLLSSFFLLYDNLCYIKIASFFTMKENMIICFENVETGKCLREVPSEAKKNKLNM
jgi:serine/threonine protein kinase